MASTVVVEGNCDVREIVKMTDEELFCRKERLEYLYKRTKNKRIWWKLNQKLVLLELELKVRGY